MGFTSLKQKIKGYIDLIRPFTLLAPVIVSSCIVLASFFYNEQAGSLLSYLWTIVLPASFSLAILNGASNALNQVTDLKADKISKPYRPIPKGIISVKEGLSVSIIMYVLAFLLSIRINFMFVVFVSLIAVFTVTYSFPPRLKDRLIFNQLWVGIPRGLLGILASWSVFGNPLDPLPLAIGLIAMLFLIGGSITKDITDSEADKKAGTHTLVNTYGTKKAAVMALPFMFFPFALIPLLTETGILEPHLCFLTLLAIPSYFIFRSMVTDRKKGTLLENTSSWALMYITYFAFSSSFSILTIAGSVIA